MEELPPPAWAEVPLVFLTLPLYLRQPLLLVFHFLEGQVLHFSRVLLLFLDIPIVEVTEAMEIDEENIDSGLNLGAGTCLIEYITKCCRKGVLK